MIQLSIEFYDHENWFYFKILRIIFPPAFNFGERVHVYVNPDQGQTLSLFIFFFATFPLLLFLKFSKRNVFLLIF